MPRTLSGIIFLSVLVTTCERPKNDSASELNFYGPDSRRAHMEFDAHVLIPISANLAENSTDFLAVLLKDKIQATIDTQLAHMYGAFTTHDKPTDFVTDPGSPRQQPVTTLSDDYRKIKIGSENFLRASYTYYDIVVFKKNLLATEKLSPTYTEDGEEKPFIFENERRLGRILKFYLPKQPGIYGEEIYQRGCPNGRMDASRRFCANRATNLCTDEHYNTVGDFWYFWNPSQKRCPIDKKEDLLLIAARLFPIHSTGHNETYPDYYKLYGESNKSEKKTILATYLMGVDENFGPKDLGRKSFSKALSILVHGKDAIDLVEKNSKCKTSSLDNDDRPETCIFSRREAEMLLTAEPEEDIRLVETRDQEMIKRYFKEDLQEATSVRAARFFKLETPDFRVLLKAQLFNPSEFDVTLEVGKRALQLSDVFIYDGHSGLGGYFAIENFMHSEDDTLPKNKYQILNFNGCSTFSYYNHEYFQKKVTRSDILGYRNLDIVTNAIGASFEAGAVNDALFIRQLFDGRKSSWKQILDRTHAVHYDDSALTQVNGDEDNPKLPYSDKSCPEDSSYKPLATGERFKYEYKYHAASGFCRSDM